MAYLELRDISVVFSGFRAVNKVNLKIDEGELRVLIGPNGAGKTTIMDMITGKTKPTEGKIFLNGKEITGVAPYKISEVFKIGRKFQGPNIFANMTVFENVEVALRGYSSLWKTFTYKRTPEIVNKIEEILKQINLLEYKDMISSSLSHGQRQWLEMGMVLAQDPKVILLDEPTSGMTADETYKTGEMIKTVMKGKTILVIEHDIDFVKQIAKTVTVLNHGEVLAEGSYEEITNNPEVIRVYLKTDDEFEPKEPTAEEKIVTEMKQKLVESMKEAK
ncbi:MAG: urea ABC transporter ATP-binding protein UrtD [Treponema sp.]|nr:urea ABC transporter ATP-binding protein UrtD [Treponema sp.]